MSHMTHFYVLLLALGIGVIAGLRSFTAPAVVSWAAALHWINLSGTWASWVGSWVTVGIFTVLAVGELFLDKQPKTPPRTAPPSFIARIGSGAFAGAVIGTAWASPGARSARASSARCSARWPATKRAPGWPARSVVTCRPRCSKTLSQCCGGFALAAVTAAL